MNKYLALILMVLLLLSGCAREPVSTPAPSEAPVLRAKNIARVIPDMADSDEVAMPVIAVKKTLQPKPPHRSKPAPDHPWRRPFKIHLDRG